MNAPRIRIGEVTGFHGLQGNLKVRPASPEAEWTAHLKRVILVQGDKETECQVEKATRTPQGVLLRLKDHPDRTSVEQYQGSILYAYQADLPPLQPGEYRADNLIGLTVVEAETQQPKGRIRDVLSASGTDFLEVETPNSGETMIIPFNNHFFPKIDSENGVVYLAELGVFLDELDAKGSSSS